MPEVYRDDNVTIEALENLGPFGNNAYIVRPAGGGPAVVVDAPAGSEAVVAALAETPVSAIVVTHSHADHWGGFDVLRAHTAAPVYIGEWELDVDPARAPQRLRDGATLRVGLTTIRVIETPGHTPGSICLLVGGALMTGDTLFPGGPGHSRSSDALRQEIQSITTRLYTLPDDTLVLPGHGPSTTIAVSKSEYAVYASKPHPADQHGDVLWLES